MKILQAIKAFLYPSFKKEEDVIKINRVYCFFSILLVPVFVLTVFTYEVDRLLLDASLFTYLTVILILSYLSSFVKKYFSQFLFIGFLFITFNVLYINYQDTFDLKSFLGLITIIFAIGLVVQNHKYSFYYSLITLVMTVITLYLVDRDHILDEPISFYIGIIFFISLVSFYVTRFKSIATKQLVYNASLLRRVFQDSPDALFLLNKQSNVIEDVNDSALKMFAIKNRVKLLGEDYLDFSKKHKIGRKFFQEEFINEEEWHKEIKYKDNNGNILWVDQVVSNIVSDDREYYLIRMTDITDRKFNEEHLQKLSLAVEQNPSIVIIYNAEGKVEYINEIFELITGVPREELIGTDFSMFGDQSILDEVKEKGNWEGEINYHKKDGSVLIERAKISTILNHKNEVSHFVKVAEDITDVRYIEDTLKIVMDNINEVVYSVYVDNDGKKTFDYISPKVEDIFGFPVDEYKNYPEEVSKCYHPEDLVVLKTSTEEMKKNPKPCKFTYRFKHKVTNQYIWAEESLFPQVDENGKMYAIFGVVRDISERIKYEATLQESEEKFRTLSWSAPIGIFQENEAGETIYINQSIIQLFDIIDPKQFDREWEKMVHPDDLSEIKKIIDESIRNKKNTSYEYRVVRKDKEDIWVNAQVRLILNDAGIILGRIGTIEDITTRKMYESAIKESEERFKLLSDVTLEAIILSENGVIIDVNDRFVEMYGYEREDVLGKSILDFVVSEQHALVKKRMNNTINETVEFTHIRKDNSRFVVESRSEVINFNDRSVRVYAVNDITARKIAQEELIKSEQNYRKLVEILPDGLIIHDHGKILFANPEALNLFDCESSGDLIDQELLDFIHPEDREKTIKRIDQVQKGRDKADYTESRILSRLGVVKTVEGCQVPYNLDGKPVVKLVIRNISDRKKVEKEKLRAELAEETTRQLQIEISDRKEAEKKLRLAQQFTRSIIDSSLDMIFASNVDDSITEFNHAAQQTFGYTLEEAFDLNPLNMFASQEDVDKVREAMDRDGKFSGEIMNKRKNGEVFPVFLSASVLINQQGERVGEMGVFRDITELKQSEKELKSSLKEKEVLLKEVHHRVKNNLQVISSILNLQTSYVSDESTLDILKECQNRIKTMSFIHESLYQSKDLSDVSFASYIQNLCSNLHYSYMMRDRAIHMRFDIEEVFLKLDTAIPCGLIINELVSNAFKYAFTGRDKGELLVSLKAAGGNEFVLTVEDNGKGIPEGFDIEQSDSLGLQLVITLVDQIRGEMDIESVDGLKYTIRFKDIYKNQDVEH